MKQILQAASAVVATAAILGAGVLGVVSLKKSYEKPASPTTTPAVPIQPAPIPINEARLQQLEKAIPELAHQVTILNLLVNQQIKEGEKK